MAISAAGERSLSAQAVADLVGGRLLGDGTVALRRVGALEHADEGTLSLLSSRRFTEAFASSRAGAVLVSPALADLPTGPVTRIIVAEPGRALLAALEAFHPAPSRRPGVDPSATIGEGSTFGPEVEIGPQVVVGRGVRLGARVRLEAGAVVEDGVEIGDDSVVGPRAVCHAGSRLGRRVVLKAGAVVGGRGFGFVSDAEGHTPIPHVGGCVLEDDVQIGSASCVDRGSLQDTVVGQGTKVDNLVHIGHNVRIGARCLLMALVGVAGSTRIGDGVILAGQAGLIDHLKIGDGARVGAKSAVMGNVPAGAEVGGYPARGHREFLRSQAALYRMARIIDQLERLVAERGDRG